MNCEGEKVRRGAVKAEEKKSDNDSVRKKIGFVIFFICLFVFKFLNLFF